jgi:hypothetical protein
MSFNYENLKHLKNLPSKALKNIKQTIDSLIWDAIDYNNRAFELFEVFLSVSQYNLIFRKGDARRLYFITMKH